MGSEYEKRIQTKREIYGEVEARLTAAGIFGRAAAAAASSEDDILSKQLAEKATLEAAAMQEGVV